MKRFGTDKAAWLEYRDCTKQKSERNEGVADVQDQNEGLPPRVNADPAP